MTVESTRPINDAGSDGHATDRHEPATQQLSLAGTGDRCANCAAALASDQRYCITCGERRGKPRFTLAEPSATTEVATQPGRSSRTPRPSSGASLIAGIATLLLAMGVGVLIGHNNTSTATPIARQPAVSVVTVAGGGGTGTTGGGSSANAGSSARKPSSKALKAAANAAASKAPPPPAVQRKAAAAAAKVVGGSTPVAPVTVTQGGSCGAGQAGCSGGKFSGTFFGGG